MFISYVYPAAVGFGEGFIFPESIPLSGRIVKCRREVKRDSGSPHDLFVMNMAMQFFIGCPSVTDEV